MVHHSICPLCSSKEIFPFLNCTDHLVSKKEFEIYKCSGCDFIFTQNYPEESETDYYYKSDDYISHSDTNKNIIDKTYQVVRNIMLVRKKRIIEKILKLASGCILDIGSGTGHFLNTMYKAGWEISGVEINLKAREYAKSKFNLDLISPESIKMLSDNSFDCITLWHVLEHFHDPDKYFEEIRRLLKPEGVGIIALPNCNSFDSKHFGKDWAAYDLPRHLWHFSPVTFSLFADKNSFSISELFYLPFDVFYISILSEKHRDSKFPVVCGIFKGIVFTIRSIFNKSRSSSVVYVIRKKAD
jgi:2-polyprenyl-3-methyl-5-hydroxy-6-metoxy-1,4-benzoquinol methylase